MGLDPGSSSLVPESRLLHKKPRFNESATSLIYEGHNEKSSELCQATFSFRAQWTAELMETACTDARSCIEMHRTYYRTSDGVKEMLPATLLTNRWRKKSSPNWAL